MDGQLVEALFARYREPVYRFLRRMLADSAAAEDLTQEVFAIAVHAAIHRLPDQDREIFLMREVAGLTYDEIALACDVTADAVRNRLHRARLALRQALAPAVVPLNRARS